MEETLPMKGYKFNMLTNLYLSPLGIKDNREVLVFDTLEMIGNIGGYLGLLLGWSAMSIVKFNFDFSLSSK